MKQWQMEEGEDPLIRTRKDLIPKNLLIGYYSFLITDNGRMGLAAKIAQPGEVVCVFHGSPLPFLIRKAGGYYRFMGQCYVHGIVEGEVLEDLEAGRMKEEWISLR